MTSSTAAHPAPAGGAVAPGALWFGLFGTPVAWSLQLLASYALTAHACFPGAVPLARPAGADAWLIALIASAAAAVVAAVAGNTAWRSWRATRSEHPGDHGTLLEVGEGRTRFMALAGLLLSGIFFLGIVMNAVPLFLVQPCA